MRTIVCRGGPYDRQEKKIADSTQLMVLDDPTQYSITVSYRIVHEFTVDGNQIFELVGKCHNCQRWVPVWDDTKPWVRFRMGWGAWRTFCNTACQEAFNARRSEKPCTLCEGKGQILRFHSGCHADTYMDDCSACEGTGKIRSRSIIDDD